MNKTLLYYSTKLLNAKANYIPLNTVRYKQLLEHGNESLLLKQEFGNCSEWLPIDMVLVGFQNSSAYRITDGQNIARMDDLDLWFESASPDWPGMIIYVYHLSSSPLLLGQDINPDCSACEEGQRETFPAQGHIYMPFNDYVVTDAGNGSACEALLGYKVKRGELIEFAGTMPAGVGTHSFVDIGFKVSDTSENPLFGLNPKGLDPSFAKMGNPYLHWVQPNSFFYWKSYSPDATFPSGVLAYPFECDGYQLPAEQHDVNFKYTATVVTTRHSAM